MNNFRNLNLPVTMLKVHEQDLLQRTVTHAYDVYRPEEILSDQVMEKFSSLNIEPRFVVMFASHYKVGTAENRILHTDVTKDSSHPRGWRKIVCGLNWELFDTKSVFTWWDMEGLEEFYPEPNNEDWPDKLNDLYGIQYKERNAMGDHGGVCIEQTMIKGPTLVRTDIPHRVLFHNKTTDRIAMSIRFNETWKTWEEAVEVFKPLYT